ncbi:MULTISPECIES: MFS transporter [Actinosynnema]|uniref:MFS transporter n=1 Tax=Actinosynnema TaxID=40566 RepID=UPI0020A3C71C|nr:MFS transporter [Actinosynnema pretiosum]
MATTRPAAAVAVTAIALGVDMFLYSSLVPLLPGLPAVRDSPLLSGVLFAVYAIALVLATPLVGRWVDRAGPRAPMLAGLVGLVVATALFALVVDASGPTDLAALLLARAAQGVAAAVSWIAGLALIAATHDDTTRGRSMGLALSAVGAGVLLGPAVSGALADAFGPRAPFLLVALLAAGDAAARLVLVKPLAERPAPISARALLPGSAPLLALTATGAAAIAFLEPVLPPHLRDLGFGATATGLVFAGAALAGALGAPVAGALADRLGARGIAALGVALTAAGFALSGQRSDLAVAGLVLVGLGAQFVLAPALVLVAGLAERVQPPAYGAAYALYNLGYTGGLALAPVLAGAGASVIGFTATARVAAGAALLLALLALLGNRRSTSRAATG